MAEVEEAGSIGSAGGGDGALDRVYIASKEEEGSQQSVPPSPSSQNAILTREHWYLGGEVTVDAALSILTASDSNNCYGVYRNSDKDYVLSTKVLLEDVGEPIYEHLPITTRPSGKFIVTGQANSHENISEAVQQFVLSLDPPLVPALQVTNFETQISIAEDPPDYERANKVLKPDIAPLPNIASIRVDKPQEAKTGQLSPDIGSGGSYLSYGFGDSNGPSSRSTNRSHISYGTRLSQWRQYPNKHRCHPKNVCSGCCYRKRTWNGYRYETYNEWYDCRGLGPLRLLVMLMFYLFCGPCFLCGFGCFYLVFCCLALRDGYYES